MIRFIDLFAGTGGLRLGFEHACSELSIETRCVLSSEIDPKACESYRLNFGELPAGDVRELSDIPEFDFLLAGFPCQSFSYAGKRRGFGDTRGTLFFEIERILASNRPKAFLLENVRGLTTHDQGRTLETILTSLRNLGYSVNYLLLNSSDFNVPQNRVRIYIVGVLEQELTMSLKSNLGAADSHAYKSNKSQARLFESDRGDRVVKDILETDVLPKYHCSAEFVNQLRSVIGDDMNQLHGYRLIDYRGGQAIHSWELGLKGKCSSTEIEFMNALISERRKSVYGSHQDGKALNIEQISTFWNEPGLKALLDSLVRRGYLSEREGRYNPVAGNMSFEVFKFLDPDSISITLTASDSNRLGVVQNGLVRRITPRECARLQGYPDNYQLLDDDKYVYKQMGNAVSVPVVQAVVYDLLKNNKF